VLKSFALTQKSGGKNTPMIEMKRDCRTEKWSAINKKKYCIVFSIALALCRDSHSKEEDKKRVERKRRVFSCELNHAE
jgi:hypothetical protein